MADPIVLSLPTEDRTRTHDFYRAAFGFEAIGPIAEDGVPEPLQFVVNDGLRLMFIPTGGFGWVTGNRPVAPADTSECLVSMAFVGPDDVTAAFEQAVAAGAAVVMPVADQGWAFAGVVADPDGHCWMLSVAPGGE